MFTQEEQNTIEQLEALVDQPGKKELFSALVDKMEQNPITDFFRACQQYYLAMDDYYKANTKDSDRILNFEKAKMNIGVAQRIAAEYRSENPRSIAAQYLQIYLNAKVRFDENHEVVLRGGIDKWFEEAVENAKPLAAMGFGPASYFLVNAPTTPAEAIVPMLLLAHKKGSVLCDAKLSQRYFSDLLNNAGKPINISLPEGLSEQELINNLIMAIRAGEYSSMSFLPQFLGDVCNALRALSQIHYDGDRQVNSQQVKALMHLSEIAKALSTVNGNTKLSKDIEALIKLSGEVGELFRTNKDAILADRDTMRKFEAKVKSNEIDDLSQKLFNQKIILNIQELYKAKFDQGAPDILMLFNDHPKLRQKENLSSNITLHVFQKSQIIAKLSEKEIMEYLLLKAKQELKKPEYSGVANTGKREFTEHATKMLNERRIDYSRSVGELVNEEAHKRCEAKIAQLKAMTEKLRTYIGHEFASDITKALGKPRGIKQPSVSWVRVGPSMKTAAPVAASKATQLVSPSSEQSGSDHKSSGPSTPRANTK